MPPRVAPTVPAMRAVLPEAQVPIEERARRIPTPVSSVHPLAIQSERALLTVIRGPNVGATFPIDRPQLLIGREPTAFVCVDDPAVSRSHALVERLTDGKYVITDLQSTNGTFVGGRPIVRAELVPGTRIQLGPSVVLRWSLADDYEEAMQRGLYEAATRDALTGLLNRRSLLDRLAVELAYSRRTGAPLSVLILDLDGFKAVNDSLGHLAGDEVLRAVALCVTTQIRQADALARYGGDELVALLRGTSLSDAVRFADRMRELVAAAPYQASGTPARMTLSIGVASLSECPTTAGATGLLSLADARLYRAKLLGRNRVCAEG